MRQKFLQGMRVYVAKDLSNYTIHCHSDIDAIVIGTYSQLCSGQDINSYGLLLLDDKEKPYDKCFLV